MQRYEHRGGGDRYSDRGSGPYSSGQRRRNPTARRSYDGANNGQQTNAYDPAGNVKHKTVKLGDQPDRLLAKMREAGSLLDAFLTHDFRTYLNSILNEVPSAGIDDEGLATYFKQQAVLAFDPRHSRLPSAAIVLKLFVDCISCLPHKHSYYVCMLWYMLHETLGGNPQNTPKAATDGDDEVKSVRAEFVDIFYKFANVRVKGEAAADDVEVVALVDKPGGVSIPVKFEVGDQRHIEYQDRALFIMIIIARIQDLLLLRIKEVFDATNGVTRLAEVFGAMRGLADFVNVGLLDSGSFLSVIELMIREGSGEQEMCLASLAGTSLMWLSSAVYRAKQDQVDQLIQEVIVKLSVRDDKDDIRSRALSTIYSYSLATPKPLEPSVSSITARKLLVGALESLKARSWVPKSLPRLYDSAKLHEFQRRVCYVPLKLTIDQPLVEGADQPLLAFDWKNFDGGSVKLRYPPRFATEETPTPLWRAPKCELMWRREGLEDSEYVCALDTAYQSQQLEVELMKPCDVYILKIYVEHTIEMFYQDLDLCAETLLLIPCKHDQFIFVFLDHLFELTFSPTPALQGLANVNIMDGIFLCHLLRRLCILEKSLIAPTMHAVERILQHAITMSEQGVSILVDFLSTWIVSHEDEVLDQLWQVFSKILPPPSTWPKSETLSATITDAYSIDGAFNPALRIIALTVNRVSRLSSTSSYKRKLPETLRQLAPEHDLLNQYEPYRDVVFCRLDNDDASRCRTLAEAEEMKQLKFDARAPLEADLLRDLLRLQIVGGRREQVIIVNECVAMLRDLVGTSLIQSLRDFTRLEQDELLFGSLRSKQQESSLKTEAPAPIVKAEMTDGADLEAMTPTPIETSLAEIVVEPDTKSTVLSQQSFPRFDGTVDWKWTVRRVSRLFSLVLHTVGARTFSHMQKCLEHYTPAIKGWKTYLSRCRDEDEMDEESGSEVLAFEKLLLQHTVDLLWDGTKNITRIWHTLAHLVNRDCVSLHTLISYLCDSQLLTQTVGGDCVFWDVIDLCVNNVSAMPMYASPDIVRNVMRDHRRHQPSGDGSNSAARKTEDDAMGPSQGIKAELRPGGLLVPEGEVVGKMEEEPGIKLSHEDLYNIMDMVIAGCLSHHDNPLMYSRLLRLLQISRVHLSRGLFEQLAEKLVGGADIPLIKQQVSLFLDS